MASRRIWSRRSSTLTCSNQSSSFFFKTDLIVFSCMLHLLAPHLHAWDLQRLFVRPDSLCQIGTPVASGCVLMLANTQGSIEGNSTIHYRLEIGFQVGNGRIPVGRRTESRNLRRRLLHRHRR